MRETHDGHRRAHVLLAAILSLAAVGACAESAEHAATGDEGMAPSSFRSVQMGTDMVSLTEPLFRVGGSESEGPTAFGRVNGGVFDGKGRLWIGDDMAGHLVRLDDRGNVADVFGRRGQGPGEFLQVAILGRSGTDVIMYDVEQRRTVVVDETTDESTTTPLPAARWGGVPRHMCGMGLRGEYVFIPLDQPGDDGGRNGWRGNPPARLVVERRDGSSEVLLTGRHAWKAYFDGQRYTLHPLQTRVAAAVHNDTVALVGTMDGDVLIGSLGGSNPLALNMGPVAGTEVDDSAFRRIEAFLENIPPPQRRFWMTMDQVREHGLPERRPFFDRVVFSSDGVMWLRRAGDQFEEERRWDAITAAGSHLGTAYLPQGEDVLAASPARVATLGRDANGAAIVSVYEHPFARGNRN